jgi:hypothetical protein
MAYGVTDFIGRQARPAPLPPEYERRAWRPLQRKHRHVPRFRYGSGGVELSNREFWALVHGVLLGGAFLLAFSGGLAGFYSLRPELVTGASVHERIRRLMIGTTTMAGLVWLTVISGTWIVYPWYREETEDSPRSLLLADPDTEDWHTFAFEWKEHIAWIAPMLATAAAFIVLYYRDDLIKNQTARKIAMGCFVAAFAIAVIAGLLGALVTKKAPVL